MTVLTSSCLTLAFSAIFRSSYPQIFRYFPSLSQSETLPPTISQLVQSPPFPLSPLPSLPSSLSPLFPLSPLPSLPSSLSPLLPLSPLPSLPSSLSPLFPLSPLPSLPSSISPLSPLSLPFPVSPLPSLIPSLPYAPLPNSSHPSPLSSRPPQPSVSPAARWDGGQQCVLHEVTRFHTLAAIPIRYAAQ
ncbi:unnamed protein product [Closterium sp. NIES-64]|nr:unnamed protein product [Closterium sp. NIES-64]